MTREKAIKIVKEFINGTCLHLVDQEAFETLIPELNESENERMREEIKEFIFKQADRGDLIAKRKKWIAYLEKQKALSELGKYITAERTKPGFMFSGNDSVSWEELPLQVRKHDYPYYFIGDLDCYPFVVEEKKPADNISKEEYVKRFKALCDAYEFKLPNREYDIYHLCDDLSKLSIDSGKQKSPEWSYPYGRNETADRLVSLAECLEMDGDCLFNGYSGTECGKFLRELARKQIGCKPAEWSEEDETRLTNIVIMLKEYVIHRYSKDDVNKSVGWLEGVKERFKSLRLQPSGNLAISFMNYLNEHRPDGKMCLSNGECADIETAFKKEDWAKIIRYVNKYQPH